MYEYKAKVINVVDGDTFDLDVDLGFKIHMQIRVRLLGVDTPEKRGDKEKELGLICTEYAKAHYLNQEVIIRSHKETDLNTDSFGRYLCQLRLENSDEWIETTYTNLGINKYAPNYNPNNVYNLVF